MGIKWPNDLYWRDRKAGEFSLKAFAKEMIGCLRLLVSVLILTRFNFRNILKCSSLKQICVTQ